MTLFEIAALAIAAAAAGAVNAIAGGGTLLTFPALIFTGLSPLLANATSTVALVIGTAGSVYSFRSHIVQLRRWLAWFLPVSLLGGWLGSVILVQTGDEIFANLVPWLLLFATVVFIGQNAFARFAVQQKSATAAAERSGDENVFVRRFWFAIPFQFLVSLYGGYFGAGVGILMLASLGFMGFDDIHRMNAMKNILVSVINIVAALWFIYTGIVDWPRVGVMAGGAIIGYFLGAHYSQRISQKRVRQVICVVGLCISAVLFWRQFQS